MTRFVVLFFLFGFTSCETDVGVRYDESGVLLLPFDTTEVIASLDVVDSMNLIEEIAEENETMTKSRFDTLVLEQIAICPCHPNWKVIESTTPFLKVGSNTDLEAAVADLEIGLPFASNNTIQVIGILSIDSLHLLPRDTISSDPYTRWAPFQDTLMTYWAYQVLKPYNIYGPEVYDEMPSGQTSHTRITIK